MATEDSTENDKGPKKPSAERYARGFLRVTAFAEKRIEHAFHKRGFLIPRLLTRWPEIVGDEIATNARPVNVTYAASGFGATLTLLTTGSYGPILQMRLPAIKEQVNAVYGYSAISHLRITQTSPAGFDGPDPDVVSPTRRQPTSEDMETAVKLTGAIQDDALKNALSRLGANISAADRQTEHLSETQKDTAL